MPQPPATRYIYVIGPEVGLQKVGLATDPKTRLATLQTACPFDLLLHFTMAVPAADTHAIERRAHRLLARWCVRNEWFETTPAGAIAAVQAASAPRPMQTPAQPIPAEWRGDRSRRLPLFVQPVPETSPAARFRYPAAVSPDGLPLFSFYRARGRF